MEIFELLTPNLYSYWNKFLKNCTATFQMFLISGLISFFLGLIFGVMLIVFKKGGIKQNKVIYTVISVFVNLFRSIPFVVLLVFLIPFTMLEIAPLIAFQIDENTDFIVFITLEIKPEIAFHTVVIIFEIALRAVEIAVEIAFHIVWKKFLIPSSSGVMNSTIAFHIACIFSEIQSITLLMIIWIA